MKRRALIAAIPAAVASIAGCGGGGGDVAGIGSGGTGISGEGVGSGGTGISSAAVGSISGFGSVIVNGVRFDTDSAVLNLKDSGSLKLGMTVQVRGVVNDALQEGVARTIFSAADARGRIEHVDKERGIVTVWSTPIATDSTTVYGNGLGSLTDLRMDDWIQIHGLLDSSGGIRATRIERLPGPAAAVISGVARQVDAATQSLTVGGLRVGFSAALLPLIGLSVDRLEGQLVRVRGDDTSTSLWPASVEPWYPLEPANGEGVALEGLVTVFRSLGSMRVDGVPVDASGARVSGRRSSIAVGARVEVAGAWRNGVLVASRLKVRKAAPEQDVDDEDDDADYSARGNIGGFRSASEFRIDGQDVDAGGTGVVFVGGTAAALRNGRRVQVTGSRVVGDVLIAERVEFLS
jgi:hypothetical protein